MDENGHRPSLTTAVLVAMTIIFALLGIVVLGVWIANSIGH